MTTFTTTTRHKLARIVADIVISGPRLFQLASDLPDMVSSAVRSYPNEVLADDLVNALTNALYVRYYCGLRSTVSQRHERSDLLTDLQEANTSRAGWETGWSIVNRDTEGRAVVRSGMRTRLVMVGDLLVSEGTAPTALRRAREDTSSQPGYYYAIGEALGDLYDDHVGARIYVNLTAAGAKQWMRHITRDLNRYRVPFQFKVLRHAAHFARIDGGILYVPRRHAAFAASIVVDLARSIGHLGARTPMFTRRIARGIAMADNPPGGGSFGLNRMQLVAEGFVDALSSRKSRVASRVQSIAARFGRAGLDLERPWLNSGNRDFVLQKPTRSRTTANAIESTSWLDVADRIGARLVRDALWHRDRCSWLGWTLIPDVAGYKPAVGVAGGDLYSGTAGIALFLARLAAATGDERQRIAALGALRRAFALTRRGSWPVGGYSGLAGMMYAARAVAEALRCDEVAGKAVPAVIAKLAACRPDDRALDIIEGRAGAIRSLLMAGQSGLDRAGLALPTAVRFGREIIDLAERRDGEWSWATTGSPTTGHLLGYSHGAAGIACALGDLSRATGEREFERAAEHAWRYEAARFDHVEQNWPDYRVAADGERLNPARAARYGTAWCHGAPGTALSLARRLALKPSDSAEFKPLMTAALQTTIASLRAPRRDAPGVSFCLCHGLAGNADIVLQVERLAGRSAPHPVVVEVARAGIDRFHDAGNWPCGVPEGDETPGLLLGLAGIGHFYLCLHDPSLPSPLLL